MKVLRERMVERGVTSGTFPRLQPSAGLNDVLRLAREPATCELDIVKIYNFILNAIAISGSPNRN